MCNHHGHNNYLFHLLPYILDVPNARVLNDRTCKAYPFVVPYTLRDILLYVFPEIQTLRCGESGFREHGDEIGYCSNCGLVYKSSSNTYHKPCEDKWDEVNVPLSENRMLGTECRYCHKKIDSLKRLTFVFPEKRKEVCHAECKERQKGTLCKCGHLELEHWVRRGYMVANEKGSYCDRGGCTCQKYKAIGKPKAK